MPTVEPGLTVKSLAEVAWLVSRVGRQLIASRQEPSPTVLREFWQSTRCLQRSWHDLLDDMTNTALDRTRYEENLARLLTTELLARVWATVLGEMDRQTGRNDLTRIAANAVSGLLQIRNRMMSLLVAQTELPAGWAARQDQLRRQCDRWTDVLIGSLCGTDDSFRFAFNPDRARDFAEEARQGDAGGQPFELLVETGVRLSFLGHLPDVSLDSRDFERFQKSILAAIPTDLVAHAGEQSTSRSWQCNLPDSGQSILLPGITLNDLRRRFS